MATQNITITIDTGNFTVAQALEFYTNLHGYREQVPDDNGDLIDNPETRGQYAKRMIATCVEKDIKRQQIRIAKRSAAINVDDSIGVS